MAAEVPRIRRWLLIVPSILAALLILLSAGADAPAADESKKVYTNDDLDARRPPRPRPTPSPTGSTAPKESGAGGGSGSSAAETFVPESSYDRFVRLKQALEDAQQRIDDAKESVRQLEERIARAKSAFRPGGDPYSWYQSNPEVPLMEKELASAREALSLAERHLKTVEEEARAREQEPSVDQSVEPPVVTRTPTPNPVEADPKRTEAPAGS